MENLIRLLHRLVQKAPYLSELDHDAELDLLRKVESDLGVSGVVPPAPGAMNAPPPEPDVPVPGPVAEPVPADEQPPPPTGTEAATTEPAAPEATNAFAGTDPNAPPAAPA